MSTFDTYRRGSSNLEWLKFVVMETSRTSWEDFRTPKVPVGQTFDNITFYQFREDPEFTELQGYWIQGGGGGTVGKSPHGYHLFGSNDKDH